MTYSEKLLRQLVERIERLEEEKNTAALDIREVYAEAKAHGFHTKVLRKLVALRKRSQAEREEEEAILETYMQALGMLPLFEAAEERERAQHHQYAPPTGPALIEHSTEEPVVGSREIKLLEYKPAQTEAPGTPAEKAKRKSTKRKTKAKATTKSGASAARQKRRPRPAEPKVDAKSPDNLPENMGSGAPADA